MGVAALLPGWHLVPNMLNREACLLQWPSDFWVEQLLCGCSMALPTLLREDARSNEISCRRSASWRWPGKIGWAISRQGSPLAVYGHQ